MYTHSAKEILSELKEQHVLSILLSYNIEPVKTTDNELWFRTHCHGGNKNKLCFFRDSLKFFCYTNCGEMNIFDFISHLTNCSFFESLTIVNDTVFPNYSRRGIGNTIELDSKAYKQKQALARKAERRQNNHSIQEITLPEIGEGVLNYFTDYQFFKGWVDEGISIEAMQTYGIRWGELEKYIIIPHYDKDNRLIGIRRRSLLLEDQADKKYMPLYFCEQDYAHSLGLNLYGLNITQKAIQSQKKIVLVESEKSVLLGHTYFADKSNIVATCGFNITSAQANLILKLGIDEVIIAFDNDYDISKFQLMESKDINQYTLEEQKQFLEYKRYRKQIANLKTKFKNMVQVSCILDQRGLLQPKDSPLDRGKEIYEQLLGSRQLL